MESRFRNKWGRLLVWVLTFFVVGCRTYSTKLDEASHEKMSQRVETNIVANHYDSGVVYDSTHIDYRFGQVSGDSSRCVRVDTVFKFRIKYRYQDKQVIDTILVARVDTMIVEKKVAEKATKTYLMSYADWFILGLILVGVLLFFHGARKGK